MSVHSMRRVQGPCLLREVHIYRQKCFYPFWRSTLKSRVKTLLSFSPSGSIQLPLQQHLCLCGHDTMSYTIGYNAQFEMVAQATVTKKTSKNWLSIQSQFSQERVIEREAHRIIRYILFHSKFSHGQVTKSRTASKGCAISMCVSVYGGVSIILIALSLLMSSLHLECVCESDKCCKVLWMVRRAEKRCLILVIYHPYVRSFHHEKVVVSVP